MKKFFSIFALMIALPTMAEDISTDSVLLQALDKTTGRTSFLTVKVNQPSEDGDLTVLVKKCLKNPPEENPENSVFMTITDTITNEDVFSGWMFSSEPALSAMDHAVYDIWVVECIEPKRVVTPILMENTATVEQDVVSIESIED